MDPITRTVESYRDELYKTITSLINHYKKGDYKWKKAEKAFAILKLKFRELAPNGISYGELVARRIEKVAGNKNPSLKEFTVCIAKDLGMSVGGWRLSYLTVLIEDYCKGKWI